MSKTPKPSKLIKADHTQNEYEKHAAKRRKDLEAEGEPYTVRMLTPTSTDDGAVAALGKVAKALTKKKGYSK